MRPAMPKSSRPAWILPVSDDHLESDERPFAPHGATCQGDVVKWPDVEALDFLVC